MYRKLITLSIVLILLLLNASKDVMASTTSWWQFQSVDTMKYSRDTAGQYLADRELLAEVSEEQVSNIAALDATHVAIATPYDEEFLPVLKAWVAAARRHNLKVWFRGNWSGWEEWFGYDQISREEHIDKTIAFIEANPDLFETGDYFSACPECENGGPGDPRHNGDAKGHRKFLIDEYKAMQKAFLQINKNVQVNLNSMNGDVAELIMDEATTQALGGVVVIDHYVETPEQLNEDVTKIAQRSGGDVILGEYGAPIPDIHGSMTQQEQADWIDESFSLLIDNPHLKGINYWTNVGGSTALWKENGEAKIATEVVAKYFSPESVSGKVVNTLGEPIKGVLLSTHQQTLKTSQAGSYDLPYFDQDTDVLVTAKGYKSRTYRVSQLTADTTIVLAPTNQSWLYGLRLWVKNLF